jgi:ABC-2 type transport system permease protein
VPLPSVFARTLRDQRWQIVGFGLALAIMAAFIVYLWPQYRDTLQNLELPPALQAFFGDLDIATAAGFLSGEYFGWIVLLLITYAVIQGTGALAGEEGSGTMDLLLAQPISRRSVVVQKTLATVAGAILILAIGWLGFLVSIPFVEIDVTLAETAVAMVNMLPITLLFFAIALWLGASAPSRGVAVAAVIGLVTAMYFVNIIATGVESIRDLRYVTPFYYYGAGRPLVDGINPAHVTLLLGIAAALFALTLRTFDRRDVNTAGAGDFDLFAFLRRDRAEEEAPRTT